MKRESVPQLPCPRSAAARLEVLQPMLPSDDVAMAAATYCQLTSQFATRDMSHRAMYKFLYFIISSKTS